MSNIYIQEPPTHGKVLLQTTVGDIDVELWSKEAPKACRNFIQLCMEGYYDGTIFHRVIREFIVQGGDPTGTGHGGESVWGKPFKDELHSRLRFVRRGLIAMANSGKDDNGSQFFFTLDATPELMNKHTIFAKVGGNTIYNMIKLGEIATDSNERPLEPPKIIKAKILANPFDDIMPRQLPRREADDISKKKKSQSKATKNFSLLSFGEEAEEDEVEVKKASKSFELKGKSSHDLLQDKCLSIVPVGDADKTPSKRPLEADDIVDGDESSNEDEDADVNSQGDDAQTERLLQMMHKKMKKDVLGQVTRDSDKRELEEEKSLSKVEELRREVKKLKKDIVASKRKEDKESQSKAPERSPEVSTTENDGHDVVAAFKAEQKKYTELKKQQGKQGKRREEATLAILAKFQGRLDSAKHMQQLVGSGEEEEEDEQEPETSSKDKRLQMDDEEEEEEDDGDTSWMHHKLTFEADNRTKVIDPSNVADADRYEIFDPRNPLNQRRREASKQLMKEKR